MSYAAVVSGVDKAYLGKISAYEYQADLNFQHAIKKDSRSKRDFIEWLEAKYMEFTSDSQRDPNLDFQHWLHNEREQCYRAFQVAQQPANHETTVTPVPPPRVRVVTKEIDQSHLLRSITPPIVESHDSIDAFPTRFKPEIKEKFLHEPSEFWGPRSGPRFNYNYHSIRTDDDDVKDWIKQQQPAMPGLNKAWKKKQMTTFAAAENITNIVKPITFLKFIADMIECRSKSERMQTVIAVLEAYNLYWHSASDMSAALVDIFAGGFEALTEKMSELFPFKKAISEEMENHAAESKLESLFSLLGTVLPPGAEKVAPILEVVGPIAMLGFSALGFTGPGKKVSNVLSAIAKNCKDTTTIFSSLDKMHDGVSYAMKATFDQESLHMKDALVGRIRELTTDFETFNQRIITEQAKILQDAAEYERLKTAYSGLLDLYDAFVCCKENVSALTTSLSRLHVIAATVKTGYTKLMLACTTRQEPTCIWLFGRPGAGKSKFAGYLCDLLSSAEGKKLTKYCRNATDAYTSGYVGQDIYIYDDFGSATEGNDIREFIPIKSSEAYPLNMADLENKGTLFNSRYIIICSNAAGINVTDVISNPEAIDRRRDFLYMVVDKNAEVARERGTIPTHYKKDFSHLTLLRYNPIVGPTGGYTFFNRQNPRTTPTNIVSEMILKEALYKKLYQDETERDLSPASYVPTAIGADRYNAAEVAILAQEYAPFAEPISVSRYVRKQPKTNNEQRERKATREEERAQRLATQANRYFEAQQTWVPDFTPVYWNHNDDEYDVFYKSFLLIGEPELGKSFLLKQLRKEGCDYTQFDEFTADDNTMREALLAAWRSHDRGDEPVIMACNPKTLTDEAFEAVRRDRDAFMRRVVQFHFTLTTAASVKKAFGRKINIPEDVIISRVEIDKEGGVQKRIISSMELLLEVKATPEKRKTVKLEERTVMPIWTDPLPARKLGFKITTAEFTKKGIASILKLLLSSDAVDLTDFDFSEKLDIIRTLKKFHACMGKTFETTLLEANSMHVAFEKSISITFVFSDRFIVADTSSGYFTFYIVECDEANCAEELNAMTEYQELIEKKDRRGKQMVFEVIDAIFYLLKMGLGMGSSISRFYNIANVDTKRNEDRGERDWDYDWKGPSKSKKKEMELEKEKPISLAEARERYEVLIRKLDSEAIISWADHMDDVDPLDNYPPAPTIPKAARSRARLMDYCATCHSSACPHCYSYVSEAYDIPETPRHSVPKKLVSPVKQQLTAESKVKTARRVFNKGDTGRKMRLIDSANEGIHMIKNVNKEEIPQLPTIPFFAHIEPNDEVDDNSYDDQSYSDEAMSDQMANDLLPMIQANQLYVGTPSRIKVRALMIAGRIGVTHVHGLADKHVGDTFELFGQGDEYIATILCMQTLRDICIFSLDSKAREFKSILKHIAVRADNKSKKGQAGWIVYMFPDGTRQITNIIFEDIIEQKVSGTARFGIGYHGHQSGVRYGPINSVKGYCGSVCMITNPSIQRKIVAIHSGADVMCGIGALLYQDDLEQYIVTNHAAEETIEILPHQWVLPIEPRAHGEYIVRGVAVQPDGTPVHMHQTTRTKLWKSPLKVPGPSIFEPVVLSKNDSRLQQEFQPYEDGMEKFNHPQTSIDSDELNFVMDELGDYLAMKIQQAGISTSVLTKTEALNGVSTIASSNPIQRDTSAGYPWKFIAPDSKKTSFIEFDEDRLIWTVKKDKFGQMLHHGIDVILDRARKGQRTAVVNIGMLKDEPRKLKKIYEKPGTRIFWAAPFDKVMCDRMYYHTACAAIADTHQKHPIKIGINPLGPGFNSLYDWHSQVSTIGFDLDASNWDSSIPVSFIARLPRVYNKIYQVNDPYWKHEDDVIRSTLNSHLVEPLVMYRDCIVQLPGGNISGQPQTGIDNSIIHVAVTYLITRSIARESRRPWLMSFDAFLSNIALSVYGDDVMMTISDANRDILTPQAFVEHGAQLGITYTPASKTAGQEYKWKKLKDLEFLKRNFRKAELPNGMESKYWCGALQHDSFHKMLDLVMTNKGHDFNEDRDIVKYDPCTITGTIEVALMEASNHGKEFFEEMRKHLIKCCRSHGIAFDRWTSYIANFNMIWGTDLPEGIQPSYRNQSDDITNERRNMSKQPATTDSVSSEERGDTIGGDARPIAPIEGKTNASSGAIFPYTGAVGGIPIQLYTQNVVTATIVWSSTQNAGTVIYSAPIAPQGCNAYVQYFSSPFNAWAGGFIWSVQIAATGFNGGKLIIGRSPPNYDINDAHTLEDFTIFDYKVFDVKETNPISTVGVDERNVIFHWKDEEPGTTESTGGTFWIVVASPLINSNGGATNVNIIVYSRPDPSYRVSQLMPLSFIDDNPSDIGLMKALFPANGVPTSPYLTTGVDQIVTYPTSTTPILLQGFYGQVQGNGEPYGRAYTPWNGTIQPIAFWDPNNSTTPDGMNMTAWSTTTPDITRPLSFSMSSAAGSIYNMSSNSYSATSTGASSLSGATIDLTDAYTQMTAYGASSNPCTVYFQGPAQEFAVIQDPDGGDAIQPVLPESFLLFRSNVGAMYNSVPGTVYPLDSTQTVEQMNALASTCKNILGPGQACLFLVIDKVTNLPIANIKFNYPGYFSCPATTTIMTGNYDQFIFLPTQIMDMIAPIPSTAAMVMNSILVQSNRQQMTGSTQSSRAAMIAEVTASVMAQLSRPPDETDGESAVYSARGKQKLAPIRASRSDQ